MGTIDFSPLAVSVQAAGTLLLAAILAQFGKISAHPYVRLWAIAWGMLFLALLAVRLYIYTNEPLTWIAYLMLEWAFLVLVWAGCRRFAGAAEIPASLLAYAFPAGLLAAAVLTRLVGTFNSLFAVQAGFVAVGAVFGFRALGAVPAERQLNGWRMMRVGLLSMTVLYAAYVPLYEVHAHYFPLSLLAFSSLADLMVSIVIGAGMLLVTVEHANADLREALTELDAARRGMKNKLNTDPLTNALNRHAFHSMQRGDDIEADHLVGCVLMIDIDNLKQINDTDGHAAGDAVIRAAANAIRARIRADDLLFRWGGDEFVAVIPNLTLAVVTDRLASLGVGCVARPRSGGEIPFRLSWGGAEFGPDKSIEKALREADVRMYATRDAARSG